MKAPGNHTVFSFPVGLTPRGRDLISGYFPRHAPAIASAMGALDRKELLTLARLCKKLGLA
jgi:hypothetical protein